MSVPRILCREIDSSSSSTSWKRTTYDRKVQTYFHRWSWAFPIVAFVIVFGSIHIVTFEDRGAILFRKYLSFFPVQKLEMRELRLEALGDDWDGEDETKLDHVHVGPDPTSKHWFSCDKPDEVVKWIRSSLRPNDVRLAPPG